MLHVVVATERTRPQSTTRRRRWPEEEARLFGCRYRFHCSFHCLLLDSLSSIVVVAVILLVVAAILLVVAILRLVVAILRLVVAILLLVVAILLLVVAILLIRFPGSCPAGGG